MMFGVSESKKIYKIMLMFFSGYYVKLCLVSLQVCYLIEGNCNILMEYNRFKNYNWWEINQLVVYKYE